MPSIEREREARYGRREGRDGTSHLVLAGVHKGLNLSYLLPPLLVKCASFPTPISYDFTFLYRKRLHVSSKLSPTPCPYLRIVPSSEMKWDKACNRSRDPSAESESVGVSPTAAPKEICSVQSEKEEPRKQ